MAEAKKHDLPVEKKDRLSLKEVLDQAFEISDEKLEEYKETFEKRFLGSLVNYCLRSDGTSEDPNFQPIEEGQYFIDLAATLEGRICDIMDIRKTNISAERIEALGIKPDIYNCYKFISYSEYEFFANIHAFKHCISSGYFNDVFHFKITGKLVRYDFKSGGFIPTRPLEHTEQEKISSSLQRLLGENFQPSEETQSSADQSIEALFGKETEIRGGFSSGEDEFGKIIKDLAASTERMNTPEGKIEMFMENFKEIIELENNPEITKKSKALIQLLKDDTVLQKLGLNGNFSGQTETTKAERVTAPEILSEKKALSKQHLKTAQTSWNGHENLLNAADLAAKALGAQRHQLIRDAVHEALNDGLGFVPAGKRKKIAANLYEQDMEAIDELTDRTGISRSDFITHAVIRKVLAIESGEEPAEYEEIRKKLTQEINELDVE